MGGEAEITSLVRPRSPSLFSVDSATSAVAFPVPVRLAPDLDRRPIARVLRGSGRVHVPAIFAPDCAQRIADALAHETPWQLHLNDGDKPVNLRAEGFDALAAEERALFLDSVHANAAEQFQYLFNSYPISDAYERDGVRAPYLMRVYEFLNSEAFLGFAREVTGARQIRYADAQATLYRPGHFLTRHDDLMNGKHRLFAYVLNFTPRWKADWGGILQFIDRDGHIIEGYAPVFNALNLFRVPQEHAVSYVAPFAQCGRYSITGWLRTQRGD
jgi:SM-20-related protein